ncbi:MAG: hypothetical protein ACYCY2_08000 [Acidithiobacillus ferriphilus]
MTQLHWRLPGDLLCESVAVMRPHGARGNEGLALWLGTGDGSRVDVTHIVEVFGAGFRTAPLHMRLSLRAMAVLTDLTERLDVFLVGQIHSHPERLLDLSALDQEHGIRIPNYLSVVCPYYAQRQVAGLNECGVHVFEYQRYRRMSTDEISRRGIVCNAQVTKIRCEVPA